MANLIPPQAKKNIIIEYWIRAVSVWFALLGVASLTMAVLNVPVYILIQNQLQSYSSLYNDADAQNTSFEQIESGIVLANTTAVLLSNNLKSESIVPYINQIDNLANSKISIQSLKLIRSGVNLEEVQIQGVADDRESLVAFSDAIESAEDFTKADIPLSNLAKDKDIPFTIDAQLNKVKKK